MIVYCYIAIVYGKTQGHTKPIIMSPLSERNLVLLFCICFNCLIKICLYNKKNVDIFFISISLAFLPHNVTAHGLILRSFSCYVVALITVLVLVIDIVASDNIVNQLINSCIKDRFPINLSSIRHCGYFFCFFFKLFY